jgi:sialic acid synthase SpsE
MSHDDNVSIEIAGRKIGPLQPPYIVCELSANHKGSLERAIKMIEVAAETGADAIKIQTYTADTLTIDCDRLEFQIKGGLWDGFTLHRLYREAYTPYEWHPALFQRARELGVSIFSTPFENSAVELLAGLNAPAYKIASFEAIDLPLITRVAREGKPMITSKRVIGSYARHRGGSGGRRARGVNHRKALHFVARRWRTGCGLLARAG